jgi:hypothetical protein
MTTYTWLGAEGKEDGQPFFLRVRDVPQTDALRSSYPNLLVIAWAYTAPGLSGLPSAEQYHKLDAYESGVLDGVEADGAGILVAVRTGRGAVRYLMYVSDVDAVVDALEGDRSILGDVVYAIGESERWAEYGKVRAALS